MIAESDNIVCFNGLDDDCDGFTDCEDPDCCNISDGTSTCDPSWCPELPGP